MTTTFNTHNVKPEAKRRPIVELAAAWQRIKASPEAGSKHHNLIDQPLNPFVGAVRTAWDEHRSLALSPDAVWLAIAQGFAVHMRENAEALRKRFVAHEGKVALKVIRDEFRRGSPDNDWPGCFDEFSKLISEHIGKKHALLVADFSTTTPVTKAANEIVLLDAMQSYFSYEVHTRCGIPTITLEGSAADWEDVWVRAACLSEFELDWWTKELLPVLEKFVLAAKGSVDTHFWQRIFSQENHSGGPTMTGWLNVFFPYSESQTGKIYKNGTVNWNRDSWGSALDRCPSGMSSAPFIWHYLGEVLPLRFLGGFIGVEQREDGALAPAIGWGVAP